MKLLPLSLPVSSLSPPLARTSDDSGRMRLLQVARFVEKKGIDTSLRALALARAQGIDASLTLGGDGPLRKELEALTNDLGIADSVRFIGFVPHKDLAGLFAAHDALIQPSRNARNGDTEGGHPTVLLEALAQGLPVLATRHADIPMIVREGRDGLLAAEGDAEQIGRQIIQLARSPEVAHALGASGRARVLRRHEPERLTRLRERIYKNVLRSQEPAWRARWSSWIPTVDPFGSQPMSRG